MRSVIQHKCRLIQRLREQARSHKETACTSVMQAPGLQPGAGATHTPSSIASAGASERCRAVNWKYR
ncbi:hypothetical protein CES87_09980 [Pseudomonas sp. ERMR1:02]|nr:hypothetical protein CES87_09980 [Pseudomonas sp. ERMR1:02]